jgi:hypothetical protein
MKRLLAIVFLCASCIHAAALTNKVLIIGIDGCMPSAMAVANTPNINALKSNGCYSVRVVTHPITHSAACWSSMFTGVWGDKHGVNDPGNSFAGNQFTTFPSFYKRLETVNSNWNTLAFARWAPMLTAVPDADVKLSFTSDDAVTDETCRRLTNSNPDVFWMLLLGVDDAGHAYGWGPAVTNYVKAIEAADVRVGKIVGALTNRVTYSNENWLVIVQTDHGEHDHPDIERSQIVFSIYTGLSAARGVIWPAPAIVDVYATVLTHMGVPIDPAWNVDARLAGLPLQPTTFGTNLVFNGNAESNSGATNYTPSRGIAWWFDPVGTTIGKYGSNVNFPTVTSSGPTNRGVNFFLGGTTNAQIIQRIDISDIAADVNDPGVEFTLSGWFGGAGSQEDFSALTARFLNATGSVISTTTIGSVTAAARTNITGLLFRSTNGTVPAATRFIEFALTNRVVTGNNDGSADNLSFVLTAKPESPFQIVEQAPVNGTWRLQVSTSTNRVYTLERSTNLPAWDPITAAAAGNGGVLPLTDTNPPVDRAFYRVLREKP